MNSSLLWFSYYDGAYGDTIRIATHSGNCIVQLKDKIQDLFDGNLQSFDFCQMSNAKCLDSIYSLELFRVMKSTSPCITLYREGKNNIFKWVQDLEELETLLGLIDGLISDDSPGHQYLAYEDDGCIIELSYNES